VLAVVVFGTLNVLWSSHALALTSAARPLSNGSIGLIGVVGLAGAIAARRAGRLADRGLANIATGVALAAMMLAWVPISLLTRSLGVFVLGLLVLDGAVQAVHVTSQSIITDAVPVARSRAVAAYMVFYALGSAGGSIASTATFAWAGWRGVSVLGAALSAVGLGVCGWRRCLGVAATRAISHVDSFVRVHVDFRRRDCYCPPPTALRVGVPVPTRGAAPARWLCSVATKVSTSSLRSGRVALYQVRFCGGSPTAIVVMSWVVRYCATIHDGSTVTASLVATISISRSVPSAAVVSRAGRAPGGIGKGTVGVRVWS
jgi:MFS family permease